MINVNDIKNGITFVLDGEIFTVLEFSHVKPGKGAAFVRTKLKNIKSGGVVEKTFRPTEKFPQARIDRKDMQYLYSDGDLFYFMDIYIAGWQNVTIATQNIIIWNHIMTSSQKLPTLSDTQGLYRHTCNICISPKIRTDGRPLIKIWHHDYTCRKRIPQNIGNCIFQVLRGIKQIKVQVNILQSAHFPTSISHSYCTYPLKLIHEGIALLI